jgi:succinate dehydrogenase / fumarate reductase, cytochrome b subunit
MSKVVTFVRLLPLHLHTSIIQKATLALSGSTLILFTIVHLLGNLQLIWGNGDFNLYAAKLNRWPSVHLALELILFSALVIHIGYAIAIARRNRSAKPQTYIASPWWQNLSDRTMLFTGPLLLVFLCVHLPQFRFGAIDRYHPEILDRSLPDWQSLIADTFKQVSYTSFYIAMTIPFGLHVRHGVKSAAQSLGVVANRWLEWGSGLLAAVLAIGFATIPAWIYYSQQ